MTYDVRTLRSVDECNTAIAGYELEKRIKHANPLAIADYDAAIASLRARIAELNGRSVSWCS